MKSNGDCKLSYKSESNKPVTLNKQHTNSTTTTTNVPRKEPTNIKKDISIPEKQNSAKSATKIVENSSDSDSDSSSDSSSEESNDDEFKDELGQYLGKKRPLESNDELSQDISFKKNSMDSKQSSTPIPSKVSVPQNQHNGISTPTTAPSTPALVETPIPKPVKSQTPVLNKSQRPSSADAASSSVVPEKLSEKVKKLKKVDDFCALNELIVSKEKETNAEINMFNKIHEKTQQRLLSTTPNHTKKPINDLFKESSPNMPYDQMLNQQIVNNAALLKNNGVLPNLQNEKYQKQPSHPVSTNSNSTSVSGDQIQYTADGRPKLMVSIELDLIRILNAQFGLSLINDQYMDHQDLPMPNNLDQRGLKNKKPTDHHHQAEKPDEDSKPYKQSKPQQKNTVSSVSNSPNKHAIPNNNKQPTKENSDNKTAYNSPLPSSSDTDDHHHYHKEKKHHDAPSNKPNKADTRKSMNESKSSKTSESPANTSQSLKRSIPPSSNEDLEINQRGATKKQKFIENKDTKSANNINSKSPSVNDATLKMRNKTTSFSGQNPSRNSDAIPANHSLKHSSKSSSNLNTGDDKKKSAHKYGQYNLDFLNSTIEEQELHRRGKQKKHEADHEKDKVKKTIAYMEAVCYFCLCAISQYRLKKAAVTISSSKSAFDLLNDTYLLLKFNEKIVKQIDNEIFTKKFKVLS